jgi:hypothetical protein
MRLAGDRLNLTRPERIKETRPDVAQVAVLVNPSFPASLDDPALVEAAGEFCSGWNQSTVTTY